MIPSWSDDASVASVSHWSVYSCACDQILDVFDTGIQGGVESNKKMLVENPLFVELSGKMFAEASGESSEPLLVPEQA